MINIARMIYDSIPIISAISWVLTCISALLLILSLKKNQRKWRTNVLLSAAVGIVALTILLTLVAVQWTGPVLGRSYLPLSGIEYAFILIDLVLVGGELLYWLFIEWAYDDEEDD